MNEQNLVRSSDFLIKRYYQTYSLLSDKLKKKPNFDNEPSTILHKKFSGVLEQAMSFVYDRRCWEKQYISFEEIQTLPKNRILDMPYVTCHFEFSIGIFGRIGSKEEIRDNLGCIHSYICHEISPGNYMFSVLINGNTLFYCDINTPGDLYTTLVHYTFLMLAKIKEFKTGSIDLNLTTTVKTHKQKRHININKIIYVQPRTIDSISEYKGYKIDFSHRFCVRGHWRKCSFIGKDREGKYIVSGFTWVIPHIRGPEDKPLINNKLRIVSQTGIGTIYTGANI